MKNIVYSRKLDSFGPFREESIIIIVNCLHFLRRQFPVEEDHFIQIDWAVILVSFVFPSSQNKLAISRRINGNYVQRPTRIKSAIFEHYNSFVFWYDVQH